MRISFSVIFLEMDHDNFKLVNGLKINFVNEKNDRSQVQELYQMKINLVNENKFS